MRTMTPSNLTVSVGVEPSRMPSLKVLGNLIRSTSSSKSEEYSFDRVYDGQRQDELLFNDIGCKLVEWFSEGFNCSLLSYGYRPRAIEIAPRIVESIIKSLSEFGYVKVSLGEVYNEVFCDLLREDSGDLSVTRGRVGGLRWVPVDSLVDVCSLLATSHAPRGGDTIFSIEIRRFNVTSTMQLVDLSTPTVALGNVLCQVAQKCSSVSYRDSTLTTVLKECISGKAKTTLHASLNSDLSNNDRSLSYLKFASAARDARDGAPSHKITDSGLEQRNKLLANRVMQLEAEKSQLSREFAYMKAKYQSAAKEIASNKLFNSNENVDEFVCS